MSKIYIHEGCEDLAKKLGLNQIEDKVYKLNKTGAKKTSSYGYPNKFEVINGYPTLMGTDEFIVIVMNNYRDWFKTSPIIKFEEKDGKYLIETENSFYELV